jgi:hypothetical protein
VFPLKKHGHCPFICPIDVLLIVCTIVADYCQETTTAKKHKKANNNKRKKTGSRENKVTKSRRAKKPDWKTTQKNKNRTNYQPIPFV